MSDFDGPEARPRRATLRNGDDLERDHQQFLESSAPHAATLQYPGDTDDAPAAAHDEHEHDSSTPTSVLLAPVKERAVPTRRRRRARPTQPAPSFPAVHRVHASLSVFASRRAGQLPADGAVGPAESSAAVTGDEVPDCSVTRAASLAPPSGDARSAFASMSPEEILAAQRDIQDTLKPDSVRFLKERWQQRGLGSFSNDVIHPAPSPVSRNAPPPTSPQATSSVGRQNPRPGHARSVEPTTPRTASKSMKSAPKPTEVSCTTSPHVADIRDSSLVQPSPVDEQETDKMLWMTDATTPLPSDTQLDQLLQSSVDAMGSIAKKRFDLQGHILTDEQIRTLPTHLGLHHHGNAPADAGYTLADILTLMRSTAVAQRVAALRILSAMLAKHGTAVSDPLVKSGAISLAFAPFPSPRAFHAAITNQVVYFDAIDALVPACVKQSPHSMLRDLFFSSRFYSPLQEDGDEAAAGVIAALAETDVVITLTRIAFAMIANPDGLELARKALGLVRTLVVASDIVCRTVLDDKHAVAILHSLCGSPDKHATTLAMIACDVIAQIVLRVAWGDDEMLRKVRQTLLPEPFLRKVCNHLAVIARDGGHALTPDEVTCAVGAMRVMRVALTFQHGAILFSAVTQATCRLLYEDGDTPTEAYLTLEAYIHCLHENMATRDKHDKRRGSSGRGQRTGRLADSFVMDQISGLVPAALAAVRRFATVGKDEETSVRAAAGHFAATLFAVYRLPFDETLLALIFNCCSGASAKLDKVCDGQISDLAKLQELASVCHAGGRLLTRVKMEAAYVQRELDVLLKAARAEGRHVAKDAEGSVWRPVANSCAEWMGLLASVRCDVKCAKQAADLLPYICDLQVVIDLLSRCVLRVDALRAMSPEISVEDAQRCAADLLPATFDGLCETANEDEIESDEGKHEAKKREQMSLLFVMKIWTENVNCLQSFLRVSSALSEAGVVDAVDLFEFLARIPLKQYEESAKEYFSLMFAVGKRAVISGGGLIRSRSETILSSVSTIPNPALANGMLQIADHLVRQGPQKDGDADGEVSPTDVLASIVLNVMLRGDANASLRNAMWAKTVDNCGSAVLFAGAEMVVSKAEILSSDAEERLSSDTEEGQMLSAYIASLTRGYLDSNRCPAVVGDFVVKRLDTAIGQGHGGNAAFSLLSRVLRDEGQSSLAYMSLSALVDQSSRKRRDDYANVSKWLHDEISAHN